MSEQSPREAVGESAPSLPRRVVRTVSPPYRGRRDAEMNAVGWGYFLGLLVLLLPLLPFIVVVWVVGKALDRLRA
ncbi:MAG: hypothetical protein ABEJ04_06805 [Halobacteriaceae archaeon]